MKKVKYRVFTLFQVVLSAVILWVWNSILGDKLGYNPLKYWGTTCMVLQIVVFIIIECIIKINVLFGKNYSFKKTIYFISVFNFSCLFLMLLLEANEHNSVIKYGYLSLLLSIVIPDILLVIYLIVDKRSNRKVGCSQLDKE